MPALAERIRQARELGDLSENFDYQDAKRQQGFVAGKMADLQAILDRARIVEEAAPGAESVGHRIDRHRARPRLRRRVRVHARRAFTKPTRPTAASPRTPRWARP
jgi:hypothetical protein